MPFKEKDEVFVIVGTKGRLHPVMPIRISPPRLVIINGILEHIWEKSETEKMYSVQIERWPLRYLLAENEMFATRDLANQEAQRRAQNGKV